MQKFQVGDRVVIVRTVSDFWRGMTGIVRNYTFSYNDEPIVHIEMDDGRGTHGFFERRLDLIEAAADVVPDVDEAQLTDLLCSV